MKLIVIGHQILASYLVRAGPRFLKDRRIVEVGSGTGLVGLICGAMGGKVWITDQPFVYILPNATRTTSSRSWCYSFDVAPYWKSCITMLFSTALLRM